MGRSAARTSPEPGRGLQSSVPVMSDSGSEQTRPGPRSRGGEEGRSTQRDLHKPLHVPSGTMLQSAFSNGMVYNKAMPWARHTNQHQKVIFPNRGLQGHLTLPYRRGDSTPGPSLAFCLPPLQSFGHSPQLHFPTS